MPHAVLEIKDCSSQMASGGTKSAEFIADLMAKHIDHLDPKQTCVDLVLFDGAANVQKAGRILEAKYPRVTSIHGAEHVVSLFFSDFAKTEVGMYFIRPYKWFGGCHHTPYAMFMSHSRKCNGGQLIGLIKPSGTRMGGYAIALTRLIRLKESFESLFTDLAFKSWLKKVNKGPVELIEFLKKADFWKYLLLLLRSLHGAYLTLRHADSKTAGMDWLYYNALQVTETLMANEAQLNLWHTMDQSLFIWDMVALVGDKATLAVDYTVADSDSSDDSSLDEPAEMGSVKSTDSPMFGATMRIIWDKRIEHLCHDFSITAWVLALDPKIRAHVRANLGGHTESCM